jgi:hypothetical protein
MQWCSFCIILLIVAGVTVWSVVLYQEEPLTGTVSWNEKLDFVVYCEPADRFSYDRIWLGCEDLNLMTIYLLSTNLWYTLSLAVLWKFVEALIYQASTLDYFTGRFAHFYETITGALLGDIVCTGMLGILIGALLARYSGWHGFRRPLSGNVVEWKYLGIGALLVVPYALSYLEADSFNYGFTIAWILEAVLVGFALPYFIVDADGLDSLPGTEFHRLHWWWFAAIIVVGLSNLGYTYLFNGWYQAWASADAFIVVMVIAIAIAGRSEGFHRLRAEMAAGMGPRIAIEE